MAVADAVPVGLVETCQFFGRTVFLYQSMLVGFGAACAVVARRIGSVRRIRDFVMGLLEDRGGMWGR